MKKLWIVLLSLAMVAAFCMPASAVDVKFSGSYYVAGEYYNDIDVVEKGVAFPSTFFGDGYYEGTDQSTAFFRQRLRVQTEFVVSPGLSLITRFDALEKIWGDNAWSGSQTDVASRSADYTNNHMDWADRTKEQENIEFEQAYIQYMSKVGLWWIGYAPHDFWGTTFGDSTHSRALVQWVLPFKWGIIGAKYFKSWEGSSTFKDSRTQGLINANDADDDAYVAIGMFKTQAIETGLKVAYRRLADNRDNLPTGFGQPGQNALLPPNSKTDGWLITPYFIGNFGPVKVAAELEYWNGEVDFENGELYPNFPAGTKSSLDMEFLSVYLMAEATFGPAFVGGSFVYASGDDPDTWDKIEGSNFSPLFDGAWGGRDLKSTLILWNEDVINWAGNLFPRGFGYAPGMSDDTFGPGIKNAFVYQLYGGYNWGDFAFKGSATYAKMDEVPIPTFLKNVVKIDDEIGWEFDFTATYKITQNLSYMVGAGYLMVGDMKDAKIGGVKYEVLDDVYMITNKLTLTF